MLCGIALSVGICGLRVRQRRFNFDGDDKRTFVLSNCIAGQSHKYIQTNSISVLDGHASVMPLSPALDLHAGGVGRHADALFANGLESALGLGLGFKFVLLLGVWAFVP